MKRRDFLRVSALASGALAVGINFAGCASARQRREIARVAQESGVFRPNAFVTVRPDSKVEILMPKSEMGQGVTTLFATLVAEELEVKVEDVEVTVAPPSQEDYGLMITGGSTSTPDSFFSIRTAAATAREMLLGAAAASWGVSRSELTVADGVISHKSNGKSEPIGTFAADAATQDIPKDPKLKKREEFKILGQRVTRVDAYAKVTGTATFGMDVQLPNMLNAYVVRPPVLGAPAKKIDDAEAKKVPGIVKIFAFERGVAIVAEKYWQAKMAAAKLEVTWGKGVLEGFDSEQLRQLSAAYSDKKPATAPRNDGNVKRALERDDVTVLDVVYDAPYLSHSPMSPMNCTIQVKGDSAEVWAPTQMQVFTAQVVAKIADVPQENVTVNTTFLGGGFGRRGIFDFIIETALIAREFDRPVKVIWSREDDTKFCYYRPQSYNRMRGAIDAEGNPVAWSHHNLSQSLIAQKDLLSEILPGWIPQAMNSMLSRASIGLFRSGTVPAVTALEGARDMPYKMDNVRVGYTPVVADVPVLFWRSVGHSFNGFVVESFIDEMAHAAKKDPFEYRRKLLDEHPRQKAVLELVAEKANWGKKMPAGFGQGIAQHHSFGSHCAQVIEAGVVDGKIVIEKVTAVIDCGFALNPDMVKAQIESGIIYGLSAAMFQEITFVNGAVQQANFDTYKSIRMFQSPEIEVHILNTDNDPTGVGEPGLPPAAPALANAIFAATGLRMRRMPFKPEFERLMAESRTRGEKKQTTASITEEVGQ